jgi:predicted ester cyclase
MHCTKPILKQFSANDFCGREPEDSRSHLDGVCREGLKQSFKLFMVATPGYHRIEDQIAEGDKVVTRLTSFGKYEGDLPGAPRTGNDMKMTSITIHRTADGKLAEKWAEKDVLGFLQQIGVIPKMGHPGA